MLMACAVTSRAAKANSTPFSVKQSDGTTITVRLHGDENFSWYTTMDNVVLARSGNDFFIADIDAIGNITPTAQLAHEKEERSSNEISLIKKQNLKAFFSDNADKNRIPMLREPIAPTYNPPYFPSTGSPTAIVILVEFKDEKFTVNDPQAVFDQYLNGDEQKEMGYGESLNYGSVKKFFTDMSFGKYQPNFDIIGPVTLSKDMAYYGKNSGSTKDVNCSEMIKEACALASEKTDFSTPKYDINADGIVDLVYIIYAGYGESNGADPNTIWAKSGIGSFGTYNGMSVQRYGLNNELNSNPYVTSGMFVTPKINGIGLFCHEFSHCLGLPDLYPYSAAAQIDNQAMEYWSIMDGGEYTYYGYCPTAYTAWEREALGWHSITTLENNATITATPISDGGQSYKMVNNADESEYIVLENIQKKGWNSYSIGHGLIAYHVKWPKSTVAFNDRPNEIPEKPGFALIPADGILISSYNQELKTEYQSSHKGDPFPGEKNVTSLTYDMGLPNFRWYTEGPEVKKALRNITEDTTAGTVTFNYMHDTSTAIGIPSVIPTEDDTRIYTINGTYIGNDKSAAGKGIYITGGKKIIMK